MATLNTTREYHEKTPIDLMQEYTICESFSCQDSPYMFCLEKPRPYGTMLAEFLVDKGLLKNGMNLLEIGCGYGSLMHGLLSSHADYVRRVFMVDLSHNLLKRQRSKLGAWQERITSIQADIHELMPALSGIDFAISNEMVGDLDTLIGLDPKNLPPEIRELVKTYDLQIPESAHFNLNIGAIKMVESLCRSGIPFFLSEHSCDPIIPEDMPYLSKDLELDGYPREIKLFSHSEYTIRFSHLLAVAKKFGLRTLTGSMIDLVGMKKTPAMQFIFNTKACGNEAQEITFELLDHIREYRWMVVC